MTPLRIWRLWFRAMRNEGYLRTPWATIKQSARLLLFVWRNRPLVDRTWWRARMRACQKCPLYRSRSRQCGSKRGGWQDRYGRVWRFVGCGCSMPLKNLLAGSVCWARQQGWEGYGWPDDVV